VIEIDDTEVVRKPVKSEAAFRTISEVSEDLEVPQHVLRFWEGKFPQIKPLKRGGGRRYYRPEDLHLLKRIRDLLYKDGYTIRGVQKLLRDQSRGQGNGSDGKPEGGSAKEPPAAPPADVLPPAVANAAAIMPDLPPEAYQAGDVRAELLSLLGELEELRRLLSKARRG
jgi:DNA-binding transcriptional MerR regulator